MNRTSPNGKDETVGRLLTRAQIQRLVAKHGREVIEHQHMQIERCCYQHGNVTTFEHSIRVACLAVWLADRAHLWYHVNLRSLIRAALLLPVRLARLGQRAAPLARLHPWPCGLDERFEGF